MTSLLKVLRLLAMTVWVGGLVFFAFVVAPVAFSVLPSKHEAGMIVAGTLAVLHPMGLICGLIFVAASFLLWRRSAAPRVLMAQIYLVLVMMLATAYVQWRIIPAMERDRIAAGGDVDAAPANDPARMDFERLHPLSEKIEGTALFMGLGVVVLMGMASSRAQALAATK